MNVAVPFLLADLVSEFERGITDPPWLCLFGYIGLRFLQSSCGLPVLCNVSQTCSLFHFHRVHFNPLPSGSLDPCGAILASWFVTRKPNVDLSLFHSIEISLSLHPHHHHLSSVWDTRRKAGEVPKIFDGGVSISNAIRVRASFYLYMIAAALILRGSLFCSTPFLRLSTSQWGSSCLRSSLIGRLQLSSSSSCLDIVRTGCLVCFFHIHAQLCSVVAGSLLIRWRTRWWRTKNAHGMVCP